VIIVYYHGVNMLLLVRSWWCLSCTRHTTNWKFIVPAYWHNSTQVDTPLRYIMLIHSQLNKNVDIKFSATALF